MFANILKHALMITSFVFIMMLLIEYVNVQTRGRWQESLRKNRWGQYLLGAFLGVTPGCLGAFAVVSLYSHRILSMGAVVATMIATSGDESFVMFAMFPGTALKIHLLLFAIGLAAGYVTDLIFKDKNLLPADFTQGFSLHEEKECHCFPKGRILQQLQTITFQRALLIGIFMVFLFFLIFGGLGPQTWDWKRITFLVGALFGLFVVSTVPDHFLDEHLWRHVLKKHLPRIFLWTFGALLVIHVLEQYVNVGAWVRDNTLYVLLIAVAVGIIPESGPHMVFVTLFASGTIPVSILIASSIVQDGHGMLPMLAVSRKSFVYVKVINIIVGLGVGLVGLYLF